MKSLIAGMSPRTAAMIVGIAFIVSVVIVTVVDDFLLANFVVPGDAAALAQDIEANQTLFGFAAFGYLLVLALDVIIGLALYVVLEPAGRNLALLTAGLRLAYAGMLAIGVLALVLQLINVHGFERMKLWGYVLFALHILVLGCSILRSEYIPGALGFVLVIASFTYIFFFIDLQLSETLLLAIMLIMAGAEIALSLWLIFWRKRLPELSKPPTRSSASFS
jgi:hypothetical protein